MKKADHVSDERAQEILDRAAAQGRKLRQDEKAKLNGPPILLAHPYEEDIDPTGWWMSEKLDGVRAYWNGKDFISRQGNVYAAPDFMKHDLPDRPLDGELWMGRQRFQETISVVKRQTPDERWKKIHYFVFDLPTDASPFEYRQNALRTVVEATKNHHLVFVEQTRCEGRKHLQEHLDRIETLGGEGLMIRRPGSFYEVGRSHSILKVKPFKDAEATVIAYEEGKGRHKGRLGALVVKMTNGKTFNIGTGLSDADRQMPPAFGAKITYRYTELTKDGIPKCASFVAVRDYE